MQVHMHASKENLLDGPTPSVTTIHPPNLHSVALLDMTDNKDGLYILRFKRDT